MIVLDTEIYNNYFLLSMKHLKSGNVANYELYNNSNPFPKKAVQSVLNQYTTISFNGLNFDLPLIQAAIEGYPVENIKKLANKIIRIKGSSWKIIKDENLVIPESWNHIDLIDVAPGRASLKIYGGRMHAPKLQDLPIDPDADITPEEREIIKKYCVNDLDTTELLYNTLLPQIQLRESMSAQYGMDLRSKSDPQIAETVIKSELHKITKKQYTKPRFKDDATFQYVDPKIIEFKSKELTDIFQHLLEQKFETAGNGSIKMPDWLKNNKIKIGNAEYQMGIGGLHSCEKSQLIRPGKDEILADMDVSSYYPSIILQQQMAPKSMGVKFLKLYQSIVTRRLNAKKTGDKVTADTLKICVNGSFGKLGSKYSPLYAPQLFLRVTITGQLALLMLIERMESAGICIVSANTDGIVCYCRKDQERDLERVAWDWMLDTSFQLERTDYRLLAARDVNNYCAIKTDGSVKRKGCFAIGGLQKNPDRNIIYTAVIEFLKSGTAIADTVRGCTDIRQFVTVRHVQGGATYAGENLGKAVRFYSSNEILPVDPYIHYTKNGNKVPKSTGCKPIMNYPTDGVLPDDIDFSAYISDAKKLLKEVGYNDGK